MTKTDKENIILLTEQYKYMNEVVNEIKTDVEKLSDKFDIIIDRINAMELHFEQKKVWAIDDIKNWTKENFASKWLEKITIWIGWIAWWILITAIFKLIIK